MRNKIKTLTIFCALLSLLWLAACGGATPTSTPTLDLDPFRTEVAATVLAQVSQTLAAKPTATPLPSPTAAITLASTPTQAASASPSPAVTLTGGTPAVVTIDQAEWVSQSVADDTLFAPGEVFTMTWRLRNVGDSIWGAAYMLRFYSGDTFGAPTKEILLGREVPPGETIDITIPMKAPARPGNYRSDWVLANESRSNFKQPVFLKITVAAPATATPTSTPTLTLTPTP